MTANGGATTCLIDSSIWIRILRRSAHRSRYVARIHPLVTGGRAATTGVIRLELLRGARDTNDFHAVSLMLEGLKWLSMVEDDCSLAGEIGFALKRHGVFAPTTDLLIAAVAIRNDALLLHLDDDYSVIARHCALRAESMELSD